MWVSFDLCFALGGGTKHVITAIPYSRKRKTIFWSKKLIEEFLEYCWIELLYLFICFLKEHI